MRICAPGRPCNRREFVTGAAALLLSGRVARAAQSARELSFVHTHTQEQLSAVYARDGAYLPDALARIAYFLRDFRTGDVHAIDPRLLDDLVDLRTLAQADAPFQVISGYRSPRTNAALRKRSSGVAEHSMHIEGRAIDVRLGDFSTEKLAQLALGMQRGGVGFYPASDFVHLDTGRVRSW